MNSLRVVQIIPRIGVGGVEVAATQFSQYQQNQFDYCIVPIANSSKSCVPLLNFLLRSLNNPFNYLISFSKVCLFKPSVVVSSLWRSHLVSLLLRIFLPKCLFVLFVHSTSGNFVDLLVTRIFAYFADEIWFDSTSSLSSFSKYLCNKRTRVLSFLLRENPYPFPVQPVSLNVESPIEFIYWGRLAPVKNIELSIQLFSIFQSYFPKAVFKIIGPDCGSLDSLLKVSTDLNLSDKIKFYDSLDFESICVLASNSSFFVQLSHHEGMAMSVVEALQMGLIPIVTPVGEIPRYSQHMVNSIFFTNLEETCATILNVIPDISVFNRLRKNAFQTFDPSNNQSYCESFLHSLQLLVRSNKI